MKSKQLYLNSYSTLIRTPLFIVMTSILSLGFVSCDSSTDSNTETIELYTTPTVELSEMISNSPGDLTWEYFNNNVTISMEKGGQWSGEIVLTSFQVRNGQIINRNTSDPISTNYDELSRNVNTGEFVSGTWVPGHEWTTFDNWMPTILWSSTSTTSPSNIVSLAINQTSLQPDQTMIVVYAQLADDSPDREQAIQPFGLILSEKQNSNQTTEFKI